MQFGTLASHEIDLPENIRSSQLPLYQTSSFAFDGIQEGIDTFLGKTQQHFYSRYGNPTIEAVAERIARLETYGTDIEAKAVMTSSGMSAIATVLMSCLKAGDKILTQGNLYGGTTELFTKILQPLGITSVFTHLHQLEGMENFLKADKAVKLIYVETPANPTLACADIAAIVALAKKYDCLTVFDNTFATPYLQRPLSFGADFVIHSTTKYLNGHGNSTAGIVVGRSELYDRWNIWRTMKLVGTNCSPFEAWLTNNGLKTLELRMERHCSNAMAIAKFLEQQPEVLKVNYPGLPSHADHELAMRQMKGGFGGMLSFELRGGLEAGIRFMDGIKLCSLAPTLGDVETLVLHPASMSHVSIPREVRLENGITDGLIRLSVGIEHPDDLLADLKRGIDN